MTGSTIFALASGRPPAAISVIRITGDRAHRAAETLAGSLPQARQAALRMLRHPGSGEVLDEALVLRFDGPASATGEDVVELHCHGGRAVTNAVLEALGTIDGLRLAQPGEFTRRAFENGRIDLTEAEGLADLIEAETEAQRKAALAVAEGGLRRQIETWRERLVQLSARAEAAIDYADEAEVEGDDSFARDCAALATELSEWLARPRVESLKDGLRLVAAGPPNAGKSSLINVLAGEDKAIVTDVPGTTRDIIEVPVSLDGIALLLVDTAGIHETDETVERIGVERARTATQRADILLWLGEQAEAPPHPCMIAVRSKSDLGVESDEGERLVSSRTGEGISELLAEIVSRARQLLPPADALVLNRRQWTEIADSRDQLGRASSEGDLPIIAEHLRVARMAFDRVTGRAGIEDVLDALFGRFCLGK